MPCRSALLSATMAPMHSSSILHSASAAVRSLVSTRSSALRVRTVQVLCAATLAAAAVTSLGQSTVPSPKDVFGFNIGDDYHMANYDQLETYWKKVAAAAPDRAKLVDIGKTAMGKPQYMMVISSPANMKKLDHYREINAKLALGKDLTDEQAHALAKEGKAVIWIDGGLHASETVGAQQIIEFVYQMLSKNDPETKRFLDDCIILAVQDNPDGMDLVANWYNRVPLEQRMKQDPSGGLPVLWEKYAGHDNNRDFFMNNLPETTNISRVLFREWYPEIMYNHHQTGPAGTVIFVPPFRDPFNYHYDPLMPIDIDAVGMAIHGRFIAEGKPGSIMRSGASYSTWYNGGLRTVTYFHNSIGILTEIIGGPNPAPLPLIPERQLPITDYPDPVAPQMWHYRQSIDYEQTANRAILDYASRNRETLLYNFYQMARNSIQRGSTDSWTVSPTRITALEEAAAREPSSGAGGRRGGGARAGGAVAGGPGGNVAAVNAGNGTPGDSLAGSEGGRPVDAELYKTVLHDPEHRDPRGYILPIDQPDFPTATKFVNALMKSGVAVMRAKSDFTVEGKQYRAGSYVIECAQAYRPQVLDMFEPQDHPNDFRYPGGPPIPPYDATGYTLALQMGVKFERVLDGFTGPFEPVTTDLAKTPAGKMTGPAKAAGYVVSHSYNDSATLTNRLFKANVPVYWLSTPETVDGEAMAAGALWIPQSAEAKKVVDEARTSLGLDVYAVAVKPTGPAMQLHPVRIALYDQYGGLMPSGWARFLLEEFEFPYTVVHPPDLDAGDLNSKYDVIVFTDGAMRAQRPGAQGGRGGGGRGGNLTDIPPEYRGWIGQITAEKTIPALRSFAEHGGSLVTIGSSSAAIASYLKLPISDAATEIGPNGPVPLSREKFYIPGSLIKTQVDTSLPANYGEPSQIDVFFDSSPAFRLEPDAVSKGVTTLAWYGEGNLLASGWAWGQAHLNNTVAAVQAKVGDGEVYMFGPEILFRGQPHGSFKMFFNTLQAARATPAK
jgi:hypothetical protein